MLGFELGIFGLERLDGCLLFGGEIGRYAVQLAQATSMAVGEVDRDLDPLPAFSGDRFRLRLQLLGDQTVEQSNVLEPTAVVGLEQVAQHHATGRRRRRGRQI
ncbi:hypothetical protein ABIA45_005154 [Bradyrhizobium sp. USDA 336]